MPDIFDSAQIQNQSTSINSPDSSNQAPTPTTHTLSAAERQKNAFAQLMGDIETSSNPFGAFVAKPQNMSLDIQMQDEEVLLLMRQHPVTQLKWVILAIILILIPLLFTYVPILNFLPTNFHVVAFVGWYLMVLGFSLEAFLDWFYNIYIVTNQRVIDVDFTSLLFKNISTAHLDRIEDVTVTNKGYLGSVFDYGTVLIQTAGAVDQFEFEDTPHPSRVSAFINELLVQDEKDQFEEPNA
jgi:hypothetical protein